MYMPISKKNKKITQKNVKVKPLRYNFISYSLQYVLI